MAVPPSAPHLGLGGTCPRVPMDGTRLAPPLPYWSLVIVKAAYCFESCFTIQQQFF